MSTIIKTGSWFVPLPSDHLRVGISRGTPRGQPRGFRRYTKLNPGPWFNSCATPEEYIGLYATEILAPLDPRKVVAELQALAGDKVPVLCCFERAGGTQWCHRSLAAPWLAQALHMDVSELGYEDWPPNLHPLAPPRGLLA